MSMKKSETIKSLISKELFSLNSTNKLSDARRIFVEKGVHHLPVLDGRKLVGMLSHTDLLRIDSGELFKQDPKKADVLLDNLSSITEVMTKDLKTIPADTTVREATSMLADGNFHSLPVVEAGEMVGIVTTTDLLRYFHSQY